MAGVTGRDEKMKAEEKTQKRKLEAEMYAEVENILLLNSCYCCVVFHQS